VEKEYPGIRISMTATLDSIRQVISVDIGFGDIVIPQPEELDYPVLLTDFPSANIMAYSLETVVAEKFQTMIERTTFNSRMKDFFDLYRISSSQTLDSTLLQEAIQATFGNRGTAYSEDYILFSDKFVQDSDLNLRWNAFLKKIHYEPKVAFAEVMGQIQNWLKPYWEKLKV
jgi:predicted nucleotidyltransferase component of viral defense system